MNGETPDDSEDLSAGIHQRTASGADDLQKAAEAGLALLQRNQELENDLETLRAENNTLAGKCEELSFSMQGIQQEATSARQHFEDSKRSFDSRFKDASENNIQLEQNIRKLVRAKLFQTSSKSQP